MYKTFLLEGHVPETIISKKKSLLHKEQNILAIGPLFFKVFPLYLKPFQVQSDSGSTDIAALKSLLQRDGPLYLIQWS